MYWWRQKSGWCIYKPRNHQRLSANPQIPRERHGTYSPSEALEGTNHADTLILDFWPPELQANKFPLVEATHLVVLCYSSHRELIHHVTLHWQHVRVLVPSQTHQPLVLSVILILAFLRGSSSTECAFKGELLKPHLGPHILQMSQSWWSTRRLPPRTEVKSTGSGVWPPGSNPVSTTV